MFQALSTYLTKQHLSNQAIYGTSFQITHFEIGSAGHDPSDPTQPLTPDPEWTETPGKYFGPKAITSSVPSGNSVLFTCDLEGSEAIGVMTSLGLIGTIVNVGGSDPRGLSVGDTFLAGTVTFPYGLKYSGDTVSFAVYWT